MRQLLEMFFRRENTNRQLFSDVNLGSSDNSVLNSCRIEQASTSPKWKVVLDGI